MNSYKKIMDEIKVSDNLKEKILKREYKENKNKKYIKIISLSVASFLFITLSFNIIKSNYSLINPPSDNSFAITEYEDKDIKTPKKEAVKVKENNKILKEENKTKIVKEEKLADEIKNSLPVTEEIKEEQKEIKEEVKEDNLLKRPVTSSDNIPPTDRGEVKREFLFVPDYIPKGYEIITKEENSTIYKSENDTIKFCIRDTEDKEYKEIENINEKNIKLKLNDEDLCSGLSFENEGLYYFIESEKGIEKEEMKKIFENLK